jgi:acyl-CoA reductase-like NAD-dependent aldehyde dehydrogenase
MEETDAAGARVNAPSSPRSVPTGDGAGLLRRPATVVDEHHEELARIESQNVGKPLAGARGEIEMVAPVFPFYAGAVDNPDGGTTPVAGGVERRFRKAVGVVARPSFRLPAQYRLVEGRPRSSTATPLSSGRRNCQSRRAGSSSE